MKVHTTLLESVEAQINQQKSHAPQPAAAVQDSAAPAHGAPGAGAAIVIMDDVPDSVVEMQKEVAALTKTINSMDKSLNQFKTSLAQAEERLAEAEENDDPSAVKVAKADKVAEEVRIMERQAKRRQLDARKRDLQSEIQEAIYVSDTHTHPLCMRRLMRVLTHVSCCCSCLSRTTM
jgi:vacuolar-type H+-ATPase subunit I/STV1